MAPFIVAPEPQDINIVRTGFELVKVGESIELTHELPGPASKAQFRVQGPGSILYTCMTLQLRAQGDFLS